MSFSHDKLVGHRWGELSIVWTLGLIPGEAASARTGISKMQLEIRTINHFHSGGYSISYMDSRFSFVARGGLESLLSGGFRGVRGV